MQLGAFSVSLAVKDLAASRAFYEALGFRAPGPEMEGPWCILRNGPVTIGLFQGMFDKNILTFNPGWSAEAAPLQDFTDVRELQARLKEAGLTFAQEADPDGTGPAHFVLVDPDGNPVMMDQHVPRPD